jgi:ketosteroid isomerase-like protein
LRVSTLKDGRVIHLQEYYDHAEALEAVGLEYG